MTTIEQLSQTARTRPHPEVAELARTIAAEHTHPGEAAHAISIAVGDAVEYMHGVTGVHSTASDAWIARKGVCQDIAQLTAGMLRSVGIPARYVSGYLYPREDAAVGDTVAGQSHAWVEWWTGEWAGFDPTNGSSIDKRHVIVARGRDYGDVTPLKGIYHGAPSTDLGVTVELTRLA